MQHMWRLRCRGSSVSRLSSSSVSPSLRSLLLLPSPGRLADLVEAVAEVMAEAAEEDSAEAGTVEAEQELLVRSIQAAVRD